MIKNIKGRMNTIKNILDDMALLPLILKVNFFGLKVPILYPFPVKKNIELDSKVIERFKVIDKVFTYQSSKSLWIGLKILFLSVFLFFVWFTIYFYDSISEFIPLYIQMWVILILFYFAYIAIIYFCEVKVVSDGIYYRRSFKWYFISWAEIESIVQQIPLGFLEYIPWIIVVFKNTHFAYKCIIFFGKRHVWSFKYLRKVKIDEVAQYIKYKVEEVQKGEE